MIPDPDQVWERFTAELRRAVPGSTYDIWLEPLRLAHVDARVLTVSVPGELRGWVTERFDGVLRHAAVAALGPGAALALAGAPADSGPAPGKGGPTGGHDPGPPAAADVPELSLSPKFSFDQFVIGDGNRFAHAAALAVAELPGQAYNPLFLYGPPGVGKTHLLHSIGNYVRRYGDGMRVRYTTVEHFTGEFTGAIRRKEDLAPFKERYRHNDVLLIDDVQFLEAKLKTEEEFFHTFNALLETGSQIVLTCDRLPRELGGVAERLRERFSAGLLTELGAPDLATRLTVLRKRVQHDGITVADPDVLPLIAGRIATNIRALEGALIRVVAFASLTGRALDAALVAEVLDGLYPETRGARAAATVTVDGIVDAVCDTFGIGRELLLSANRTAGVAWARQVAMYLAREHTGASLPAIGAAFGGRNHTTVMHACKRATERLGTDNDAYETVRALTTRLLDPPADRV